MKLIKVIKDKGNFLKTALLVYEDEHGNIFRYSVVSKRPITHDYDLDGYTSGIMAVVRCGDKVLISREFRLGVNRTIYGFPSGMIDHDESPEEAASREVREETGIKGVIWDKVDKPLYINPALSPEKLQVIYGRVNELQTTAPSNHASEPIQSSWLDISEIPSFIAANEERFSLAARLIIENIK